jgi:DNA ligase-1
MAVPSPVVASTTSTSKTAGNSSRGNCLLAHSWDGDIDPTGYFISEKFDGLRAIWDGKEFWSRENAATKKSNIFYAPDFFKAGMPDHPLDGELFLGRGKLQETVSICKTQDKSDRWKKITYMVFDRPDDPWTFEERIRQLQAASFPSHVQIVKHSVCTGVDHLKQELEAIESVGGEGLMLRKPGSVYELGRSHTILKVKSFFDSEATVTGHTAGKAGKTGNRVGTTGALECVTHAMTVKVGGKTVDIPTGVKFKVGSGLDAKTWNNPPPIGSTISYRFFDLTKDLVPRNPTFIITRDYE